MATTRDEVSPAGLLKSLRLIDATTLVMGSMIGSGIFIVAADISRQVASPGLMITTWVVTAILTMIAALSYGELAAAMPQAGGQYVYLREAFGPLSGFLYGWTLFLVIQTGTLAAVAVAFAKFAGVFLPWISAHNVLLGVGRFGVNSQQLVAISVLVLLTWVNTRGVRTGALVQNTFTFAKVGALLGLVFLGLAFGRNPAAIARNFSGHFWGNAEWTFATIRLVGVAMVGSLFAADAWNNVTFTAGEIRNPRRNVPLALGIGVAAVSAIYIACNLVYLRALPLEAIQHAPEDRVATAAAAVILGPIAVHVMAAAIMISTFGCLNGMILAGARVYYAMALDRLFFRPVARLDPRRHTPRVSLAVQCVVGVPVDPERDVQRSAGLCYLRGVALLHSDHRRGFRVAAYQAGNGTAVSRVRLSGPARLLHSDGGLDRDPPAFVQAELHLAGIDYRAAWSAGLLLVALVFGYTGSVNGIDHFIPEKTARRPSLRSRGTTPQTSARPDESHRARHRSDHRRRPVLPHGAGRRAARRTGRRALDGCGGDRLHLCRPLL